MFIYHVGHLFGQSRDKIDNLSLCLTVDDFGVRGENGNLNSSRHLFTSSPDFQSKKCAVIYFLSEGILIPEK